MSDLPVFVICRDRVSCLSELVSWLEGAGHERIYFVDNNSSYEPLLEYYERTPHHVVRLDRNAGKVAPWSLGIIERFTDGPHIVTDPDVIPTESCPHDAADHLLDVLRRHPERCKVGLGLVIHDLPDAYALADLARSHELQFWKKELEPGLYVASVDTTFAVYARPMPRWAKAPALRTGFPYVACHVGWYHDSANLTEEERYYREHLRTSTWSRDRPRLRHDRSVWGLVRKAGYRLARRGVPRRK